MRAYLVLGLIVLGAGLAAGSYYIGRSHEQALGASRISGAIIEAQKKRGDINAEIESTTTHSLCISLGGLPDQCEQLRGVGKDKP